MARLNIVETHAEIQKQINQIEEQIKEEKQLFAARVQRLYQYKQELENAIYFGERDESVYKLQSIPPNWFTEKVNYIDLCNYARKICITTSAPPNWQVGQPLGQFLPPNPQEDAMRAGLLFQKFDKLKEELHQSDMSPVTQIRDQSDETAKEMHGDVFLDLDLNPDLL